MDDIKPSTTERQDSLEGMADSQPSRGGIGDSIFFFFLSLIAVGIPVVPVLAISLLLLPGGTIEQVITWSGPLIWILCSIGLTAITMPGLSTEESDSGMPSTEETPATKSSELKDELSTLELQTEDVQNKWFISELIQLVRNQGIVWLVSKSFHGIILPGSLMVLVTAGFIAGVPDEKSVQVILGGGLFIALLGVIGHVLFSLCTSLEENDSESSTERGDSEDFSSEDLSSAATPELKDELSILEVQTDDGWFEAEVTQIAPTAEGDQIAMTVVMGDSKTMTWQLEKPTVWTNEYLFVRLAEQYDYGANAVDLLEGEVLHIRPETDASNAFRDTTGTWELRASTQSERLSNRIGKIAGVLYFPPIVLVIAMLPMAFIQGFLSHVFQESAQVIYWGSLLILLLGSFGISAIFMFSSED